MEFKEFFQLAFANPNVQPFRYQETLATADPLPNLLRIPTGLGKTAAVVLAWLWRRRHGDIAYRKRTPRRLVYCLPMRVLVEQTRENVSCWLKNLRGAGALAEPTIPVSVLMGGEERADWAIWPERELILIGTQDMLLSRALNRGYGASRYRWPWEFGLLHQDALWVFDEVQLMDAGTATSAQLEAFRKRAGAFFTSHSLWMSATLESNWLCTADLTGAELGEMLTLREEDRALAPAKDRLTASKRLERGNARIGDSQACAMAIVTAHQPRSLTLAMFNTVERASEAYRQVKRMTNAKTILLHSRFRPPDRRARLAEALEPPPPEGTIVVATQVVEAGVDISARTLLTELASWSSLVQRFGRLNRYGEYDSTSDSRAIWFDWPDADDAELEKLAAPYTRAELEEARERLRGFDDVGPQRLEAFSLGSGFEPDFVPRHRDLIELFDTTPDLSGADIDISRFIRSGNDLDVQLFWRPLLGGSPPDPDASSGAAARPDELCPVPYYELRSYLRKKAQGHIWRWDPLERRWSEAREEHIFPGQSFLVDAAVGGYSSELGWSPGSDEEVNPVPPAEVPPPANDADEGVTAPGIWESIEDHTNRVVSELETMLKELGLAEKEVVEALQLAARWHDRGKVHRIFQEAIRREAAPWEWGWRPDLAKAPDAFWRRYSRPGFRHELGSALHMLQAGLPDLAVYLAAAHHGKVRMSIRSLPNEQAPADDPGRLYARGIWDGDELPEVNLGGGVVADTVRLKLDPMRFGRSADGAPSWTARMVKLRDRWGPFRLAFLEALLRAADARASRSPQQGGTLDV